jgi:acyl-CoA thioester hydrolase
MNDFFVKMPLRIDWSDMDLFGHVNNVAYFRFIQASRVNYWEMSGLQTLYGGMKLGPILLSTSCQFIIPLMYPGNIVVESRVEFIKNTSFGIHHRILNDKNEITAEAHDVIVTYDFEQKVKMLVPESFRQKVELIEGRKF